ncbi:hypothetical protein LAZ40_09305 [Cereibacter sphaeroides]|uniref:hypothetical protein n=1 Tax=Cereibacter sphaeroides TaxID=1063 RepID=UPI001F2E8B9E|nr:hypothetical protein [Cereibacter sphaeroides]MCE6959248.1 hypothetical protein [Cereibacter sphaeroides]MCE6972051.1 hypothetical protein [Cereibacter sphaeroides]
MNTLAQAEDLEERVTRSFRSLRGMKEIGAAIHGSDARNALLAAFSTPEAPVAGDVRSDEMFGKILTGVAMSLISQPDYEARLAKASALVVAAIRRPSRPTACGTTPDPVPAPSPVAGPAPFPAATGGAGSPTGSASSPAATVPAPQAAKPVSPAQGAPAEPAVAVHPGLPLFASLPEGLAPAGHVDPGTLLLPGPAGDAPAAAFGQWVSGLPWSPAVVAIRLVPSDHSAIEDIAELEAEAFAAPKLVLARPGMRASPDDSGTEGARTWLTCTGRDLGVYAITCEQVFGRFRDAVERTILRLWPRQAAALHGYSARLVPGEDVPDLLACAWDIETFFLRDTPDEEGRRPQDARGSISPSGALLPGACLDRAAFLHLVGGRSLASALMEALIELRLAQAMRDRTAAECARIVERFDATFFKDCGEPLEAYRMEAPAASPVPDRDPEPSPEY